MTFILSAILTYLLMKHIIIPFAREISEFEDGKDDWIQTDTFDVNDLLDKK